MLATIVGRNQFSEQLLYKITVWVKLTRQLESVSLKLAITLSINEDCFPGPEVEKGMNQFEWFSGVRFGLELLSIPVREMVISISWVHTLEIIAMNYFQGKPAEASAWVQ